MPPTRSLSRNRSSLRLSCLGQCPGPAPRALIGEAGGNILEVAHQRAFSPLAVKSSEVTIIMETQNAAGFEVRLLEGAGTGGF
jgi:hypothetical protein